MTEVHMCELLRSTEQGDWQKFSKATYLTIDTKGGVTLRVSSTNTLILDLPASAIGSSHVISDKTIRILTKGASKLALQFEHTQSLDILVRSYEINHVPICKDAILNMSDTCFSEFHDQTKRGGFPNVHDPAVQEVLLRLLFSEPFDEFVKDLEGWLAKARDQL